MNSPPLAHSPITLATKVTIARILGVPVFITLLLYYTLGLAGGERDEWLRFAALVVFMIVALTDALDGYLARSRNEVTHLGKLLDPIADKGLLLSGLLLLTRPGLPGLDPHIPLWLTLLVLSRDAVLVLGSVVIHLVVGSVEVRPRLAGKIATFLQMLTIVWVLAAGAPRPFVVCVALAGFFTALSAALYVTDGVRQLEKSGMARRLHPRPRATPPAEAPGPSASAAPSAHPPQGPAPA